MQSLIQKEVFAYVDLYFAEALLKKVPLEEREPCLFLLSYLLAIARQGHLCLHVDKEKLDPPPSIFTSEPKEESLIEKEVLRGIKSLPPMLFQDCSLDEKSPVLKPICLYKESYYLQKNWLLEVQFLFHIKRLLKEPPRLVLAENFVLSPLLNEKQSQAAFQSLHSSISLISGGPGTGKTFTAIEIVKTFLASLPEEQRSLAVIKIAAPTGKAAAHLEKNLRKHLGPLKNIECGTLHYLLKIQSKESIYESKSMIFGDVFLIDEASMIDAQLFVKLLSRIRPGGRLILMGDRNQLPPIESGGFFSDLIDLSLKMGLSCTTLEECLRMEKKELLEFATAIFKGDEKSVFSSPFLHVLLPSQTKEIRDLIWHRSEPYFDWPVSETFDPALALISMDKFRILSCLRKGLLGVESLNQMILSHFLENRAEDSFFAVPILITANDYSLQLMNGDTGVLVAKVSSLKKGIFSSGDTAYFFSKEEGAAPRFFSGVVLPSFELGYCLSVHKSQGSEYESVLALAPPGSEGFGREVLYTAITRAKKELVLMGEKSILSKLLSKSSRKSSGLHKRF